MPREHAERVAREAGERAREEAAIIANAPHLPVHPGSMGESIKTVTRENAGRIKPGKVYVLKSRAMSRSRGESRIWHAGLLKASARDVKF